VRGAWDLIVACKGSLVVAWRRGGLRTGLACLLAALAVVGVVGALWLLAGGSDDAAAPIDGGASRDRGDVDAGASGPRGTVPATPLRGSDAVAPGSAEEAGAWAAIDHTPGPEPDASAVGPSGTTTTGPSRVEAPSPSTPVTTVPSQAAPPDGTTTTTGPGAPPAEDPDAGGLGGLLGGVLDVLGVG
jgi:hypothetical protein